MSKKYNLIIAVLVTLSFQPAAADKSELSKYSGQQTRTIKSFSADDIAELESGGGWGLAKVAELNGLPGPVHLLELQNEIELSENQLVKIQQLYSDMKTQAIEAGMELIRLEGELEARFQSDIPSDAELKTLLSTIGQARSQLRYIHLSTHLKTPDILTDQQIKTYNKLRGYTSTEDPCENVPKGHDATMWRKHNHCE